MAGRAAGPAPGRSSVGRGGSGGDEFTLTALDALAATTVGRLAFFEIELAIALGALFGHVSIVCRVQRSVMRTGWTPHRAAAIAAGGAAGAGLRWIAVTALPVGEFPWPVLLVNVIGSFLVGVFLAEEVAHPRVRLLVHDAGGIGLCGGLTTFSTFTVELVRLVRHGSASLATVYAATSIVAALVAAVAGAATLRRVRALTLPLEEAP